MNATESRAQTGAQTNTNTNTAQSWRDSLPADLAADKNLAKFADVAGVAKGYLEMQTKMGETSTEVLAIKQKMGKMIEVPDAKATPEQVAAFHRAIGVPETAEGYEMPQMPEGMPADPARIKAMTAAAKAAGVPAAAMKALALADAAYQQQMLAEADAEAEAQRNSLKARDGWRGRYEANVEIAKRGFKIGGNDELGELLAAYNLQDHPAVVAAFYEIGKLMGESHTPQGDKGGSAAEADPAIPRLSYPATK